MRNCNRTHRTGVPHNDQFRNLWRPREGRYRRPRLDVLRNKRARSEREEPEQQLYMSDDEPGLKEVTHEEDSSNPKARKPTNPEAKADMTDIDPLGTKQVTITFEPLWDKDGRRKNPIDYQKRLGKAHPVLTQGKGWKKKECMNWCRANPGKERWIEGGSGYFISNVTPATSYTGSTTDTEALTLHLKNQAKKGKYSAIAQLYCTGQVTTTVKGYVCKVKTAAADQEEEEEEENDEQEEEGGELEEEEEEEEEQEQGEEQGEVAEEEEEEEEEQQQQPEQPEQAQASSTPSSTTAEDTHTGGDEFARVLFEASEDPDLKRKADQLASGFDELKRDLANKKQKQTAAHAAKKELTELREKITNNTWEVTDCTRTNAEQQKCTVPLLDWLMAREVYKTHDVKVELVIQSPNKSKRLKVDVALIARNKTTDNDIRIECKLKKFTEARGQCAFYHDWDVRPGVWTYVYSYFPEKPCDDVIQGFEIDSTFVLWPGEEEMIRLRG